MARVPMVPARELPGPGPVRLGWAPASGEGRVTRSLQDPPGPAPLAPVQGPCPRGLSLQVPSPLVQALLAPVQQDQSRQEPAWDPKWPHRTEVASARFRLWAPGPWPEKHRGRFG